MSGVDVTELLGAVYQAGDTSEKEGKEYIEDRNPTTRSPEERRRRSSPYEREEGRERDYSSRRDSHRHRRRRSPSPVRLRSRRPLSRREKTPPELSPESQAEQDSRTVFATGLPTTAREKDLLPFFEKAGKVKVISLISDRHSRRSKGIGYIQFEHQKTIPQALLLNGQKIRGHTVSIQATMAEKNLVATSSVAPKSSFKVFASNLDPRLTEDYLIYFFEQLGAAKNVVFHDDYVKGESPVGSTRRAIINYKKAEEAKRAMRYANGFKILDYDIKVEDYNGSSFLSSGSSGEARIDLDGADDQGIRLDNATRVALMNRLSHRSTVEPTPPPVVANNRQIPTVQTPTAFVMLKNMFDPAESLEDPEVFKDVKEAVSEECTKFGVVEKIFADEKAPEGFVFIQLDSVHAAEKTRSLLNGRWYAGKMVSVEYLTAASFNRAVANFPFQ